MKDKIEFIQDTIEKEELFQLDVFKDTLRFYINSDNEDVISLFVVINNKNLPKYPMTHGFEEEVYNKFNTDLFKLIHISKIKYNDNFFVTVDIKIDKDKNFTEIVI